MSFSLTVTNSIAVYFVSLFWVKYRILHHASVYNEAGHYSVLHKYYRDEFQPCDREMLLEFTLLSLKPIILVNISWQYLYIPIKCQQA